ncbi:MAG: DUF1361 domain-containing protein [Cyanobacteriota bacterium]|nr:DUF1361 domain-containing protein [Cyanobacteriota bacterium]
MDFTDLTTTVWKTLLVNRIWMTWNLFLALLPLAISLWLFDRPRSTLFRWGVVGLTAAMFVGTFLKYPSYLVEMILGVLQNVRTSYLAIAVVLTLVLMGLEIWVVGKQKSRSPLWWLGCVVFIAFLPNAPYVLTDIIHLIEDIRRNYSAWTITLVLVPQYLLFAGIGFQAYVLSLINLGEYMKGQGLGKFVLATELFVHGLCAIGIYLGRFWRFNSWDLLTKLDTVLQRMANELFAVRPLMTLFVTFGVIASLYYLLKWVTESIIIARQVKQSSTFEMAASSPPE